MRNGGRILDPCFGLRRGQRAPDEVTLPFRTPKPLEENELIVRFDAFGNHTHAEVVGEDDDGIEDGGVVAITGGVGDETPVDFQAF